MAKRKYISQEIRDNIVYNYTILKQGRKKSGEQYNFSDNLVKRILLEEGIKLRNFHESKDSKYFIDKSFFFQQSEELAYLIGWIAADGSLGINSNRVEIDVKSIDKEILEQLRTIIKSERPIKTYPRKDGYTGSKLWFENKIIYNELLTYGLVPRKTYSENYLPPYRLNKKYWKHYIRGLFDGDGSVTKTTSLTWKIISTNKTILEAIHDFLLDETNIKTNITEEVKETPIYTIYAYGKEAIRIFIYMYSNTDLCLKRKKEKFINLINESSSAREFVSQEIGIKKYAELTGIQL